MRFFFFLRHEFRCCAHVSLRKPFCYYICPSMLCLCIVCCKHDLNSMLVGINPVFTCM